MSRTPRTIFLGWGFVFLFVPTNGFGDDQATHTRYVGIGGMIEQWVVPGTELEVIPQSDRRIPLVLRIVAVYPHGSAFRYDIEYYGLEPGTYDIARYLAERTAPRPGIFLRTKSRSFPPLARD